jgi:hypothetical protein
MRFAFFIALALLTGPRAFAQDGPSKADYTEFSRLIQKIVVKQLPKEFEDHSSWGRTIPIPAKLLLPNLRTYVKVGDAYELPHGAWRRVKGWLTNPEEDVQIVVRDFKAIDAKNYRVVIDVDAKISCSAVWQQWQKGLMVVGAAGDADARVAVALVCDVAVSLDASKLPPDLKFDPKITELSTELRDFKLTSLGEGELADRINDPVKEVLQTVLVLAQPKIREQANLAIVQGLRQSEGTISSAAILKALSAGKAKQ